MSEGDAFSLRGLVKAMAARIKSDGWWTVKLAYHPEWISQFIKSMTHGGNGVRD
jgi:hypothetical protein